MMLIPQWVFRVPLITLHLVRVTLINSPADIVLFLVYQHVFRASSRSHQLLVVDQRHIIANRFRPGATSSQANPLGRRGRVHKASSSTKLCGRSSHSRTRQTEQDPQ